jgi:hypothetical protein
LGAEWRLASIADFDGDGTLDLVWQSRLEGTLRVWCMKGSSTPVAQGRWASRGFEWKVAGAGDYNADGKPDILWQNSETGELSIWMVQNWGSISEMSLGTGLDPTSGWHAGSVESLAVPDEEEPEE